MKEILYPEKDKTLFVNMYIQQMTKEGEVCIKQTYHQNLFDCFEENNWHEISDLTELLLQTPYNKLQDVAERLKEAQIKAIRIEAESLYENCDDWSVLYDWCREQSGYELKELKDD